MDHARGRWHSPSRPPGPGRQLSTRRESKAWGQACGTPDTLGLGSFLPTCKETGSMQLRPQGLAVASLIAGVVCVTAGRCRVTNRSAGVKPGVGHQVPTVVNRTAWAWHLGAVGYRGDGSLLDYVGAP